MLFAQEANLVFATLKFLCECFIRHVIFGNGQEVLTWWLRNEKSVNFVKTQYFQRKVECVSIRILQQIFTFIKQVFLNSTPVSKHSFQADSYPGFSHFEDFADRARAQQVVESRPIAPGGLDKNQIPDMKRKGNRPFSNCCSKIFRNLRSLACLIEKLFQTKKLQDVSTLL